MEVRNRKIPSPDDFFALFELTIKKKEEIVCPRNGISLGGKKGTRRSMTHINRVRQKQAPKKLLTPAKNFKVKPSSRKFTVEKKKKNNRRAREKFQRIPSQKKKKPSLLANRRLQEG